MDRKYLYAVKGDNSSKGLGSQMAKNGPVHIFLEKPPSSRQ